MSRADTIQDETRGTDFTPVAHYTSEPYEVLLATDGDSDQETEYRTTTVDVRIVGNDTLGYILRTSDDADGPSDDLGDDVYQTLASAVAELRTLVLARTDGWLELAGEYAEADAA